MPENKHDIIHQLRQDILLLQGFKVPVGGSPPDLGLGQIERAFPYGIFPTGAIHEFITHSEEDLGATTGFLGAMLGRLMKDGGTVVWIGPWGTTVAEGLTYYGVDPDRFVFVAPPTLKKALWALEETLRCDRFLAVVAEISELNFVQSRRLQLVVEQSRVTGFLLRHRPRQKTPVASVAQWRVTALPTQSQEDRPGRGFPRWKVDVLKIRNRSPVSCVVEWTGLCFASIATQTNDNNKQESKTG
jgi:protein ImuA